MGWLHPVTKARKIWFGEQELKLRQEEQIRSGIMSPENPLKYGATTRFNQQHYEVRDSLIVWSSGMWVCTPTGASAAMAAAGGVPMNLNSSEIQFKVREHLLEHGGTALSMEESRVAREKGYGSINKQDNLHLRWNSQKGKIYIDGSHLSADLELGDEILINGNAPELRLFMKGGKGRSD